MVVVMVVVRLLVVLLLLMVVLVAVHIALLLLLLAIGSSSGGACSTSLLVLLMTRLLLLRLLLGGSHSSRDENGGRGRQLGQVGQRLGLRLDGQLLLVVPSYLPVALGPAGVLPEEMRLLLQPGHGHSAGSSGIRPAQLLILIVGLEGGAA